MEGKGISRSELTELCGQLMEATAAMAGDVDVLADSAAPHLADVAADARKSIVAIVAIARSLREASALQHTSR
ncbi:MAG TPA: hypothetical protein VIY73_16280 [Polyangiaceae bacterium]